MAVVGEVLSCEREVNNYRTNNFVFVIFVLMLESENFLKYGIHTNGQSHSYRLGKMADQFRNLIFCSASQWACWFW